MRRPPSSLTDRWTVFQTALTAKPERLPPGDGWLTRKQMQAKFKQSDKVVLATVKRMGSSLERFTGYANIGGRLIRQVWYRPTQ